jgi:hypothetical protein
MSRRYQKTLPEVGSNKGYKVSNTHLPRWLDGDQEMLGEYAEIWQLDNGGAARNQHGRSAQQRNAMANENGRCWQFAIGPALNVYGNWYNNMTVSKHTQKSGHSNTLVMHPDTVPLLYRFTLQVFSLPSRFIMGPSPFANTELYVGITSSYACRCRSAPLRDGLYREWDRTCE